MSSLVWLRKHPAWFVLAVACLVTACSSVDLGPQYSPPPIRVPEPLPAEPVPAPVSTPVVQPQPVPPLQPVPQVLPPVDASQPDSNLVTLSTRLDGASAIPPARSGATGQIDALYDSATRSLRWKASWSGLSGAIVGVQFHGPASAGQVAAPVMIWPGPFGPRYEGRATLTLQQAADLLAGRWYVNVETPVYPQGELRGQMQVVR
ncbi:MAG TPA: CHRD domain-containing protein [Ottowia sp.]|uniref:CHRD domain-containing protein n=1 Tax=Ottowia sp. TaxID=1898956 RepID=UPI002CCA7C9C|nr:CHRD domain-containing protein [Ottowia sp.]HMN21429.1 CHRD domain-containing protein [Ottowia sp.]